MTVRETQLSLGFEVPNTDAEGPGRRYAIWVQGCPLRCPGCCNPELLGTEGGSSTTVAQLLERVLATPGIEGISLLGGEPFAQPQGCAELAQGVAEAGLSVVVFSGFTLRQLRQRTCDHTQRLLDHTDLLIDGPYLREQPDDTRRWVGSRNQQLHFLSARYSATDRIFYTGNTIELRLSRDGTLVANGWPAGLRELET